MFTKWNRFFKTSNFSFFVRAIGDAGTLGAISTVSTSMLAQAMASLIGDIRFKGVSDDNLLATLERARKDVESALDAITTLQRTTIDSEKQIKVLHGQIEVLKDDRTAAETMLSIPQEAAERLISGALMRGRIRGWIEGAIIGLITGGLSSYVVYLLTQTAAS